MGLPVVDAAEKEKASRKLTLQTWFHRISFLLTGIFTTIVNQVIFYHGVGDPATGMLSLPTYLGMLSVLVMPVSRTPCTVPQWKFAGVATVDVLSAVLCILGMQVVGSGVYQVLYSSVVCFTAFFSTCFLRKSHSVFQWIGVLAIAGGLAITSHDSVPDHPEHGTTFVAGIFVTLVGCVGYACSYVLNEAMLGRGGGIVPQRQCVLVGAYGTVLHLAYILIFIAPEWETRVVSKVLAGGTPVHNTVALYVALVMSAFLHNMAYFHLLAHTGAVSTGVLTALRAVGVFYASGYLFCEVHTAQCLTAYKVTAALTVAAGTLIYSFGSAKSAPPTPMPGNAVEAGDMWSELPRAGSGTGARSGAGGVADAGRYVSETSLHDSQSGMSKEFPMGSTKSGGRGGGGKGAGGGGSSLVMLAAVVATAIVGDRGGAQKQSQDLGARKKSDDEFVCKDVEASPPLLPDYAPTPSAHHVDGLLCEDVEIDLTLKACGHCISPPRGPHVDRMWSVT